MLPTASDFPSKVTLAIVPPSITSDAAVNCLVLLHGLGDSHASFTKLAQQMNLPETVCISVRGPQPLLDLGGFHWGDDIVFNSSLGGLDADAGFKQSTELLKSIVQDSLVAKCGYKLRDIHLLGFGQGGMSVLKFAGGVADELGGVISIGGGLPSDAPSTLDPKSKTPVLVCAGSNQSSVTSDSEEKLRRVFGSVEVKRYRRSGDGMPSNRDEMMPIMQFFARRLKSRKGVPRGAVEVG